MAVHHSSLCLHHSRNNCTDPLELCPHAGIGISGVFAAGRYIIVKAKHQRLTLAIIAIFAVIGAGFLALIGLRDNAALFRTPAEISAEPVPVGQAFRLGGMVARGSIEEQEDGVTIRFIVQDAEAEIPVLYSGITPDLFRENSGVVAEGALDMNAVFVADTILAKHDENYMPPELAGRDLGGDETP